MPAALSRRRISALSCANRSASAPGWTDDPGGRERRDVLVRDVLVVERDDVAADRERAQVGQRAVVPDHDVAVTSAAPSSADSASTRSDWPSAMAA